MPEGFPDESPASDCLAWGVLSAQASKSRLAGAGGLLLKEGLAGAVF